MMKKLVSIALVLVLCYAGPSLYASNRIYTMDPQRSIERAFDREDQCGAMQIGNEQELSYFFENWTDAKIYIRVAYGNGVFDGLILEPKNSKGDRIVLYPANRIAQRISGHTIDNDSDRTQGVNLVSKVDFFPSKSIAVRIEKRQNNAYEIHNTTNHCLSTVKDIRRLRQEEGELNRLVSNPLITPRNRLDSTRRLQEVKQELSSLVAKLESLKE